jgi:hypothetical protein
VENIDFDLLQKESLAAFINNNPEIKNKKLMMEMLDTQSKLICTILAQYHKQVSSQSSQ